jgi:hypothetical protein
MELLEQLSEIFVNSFLLATLANLTLTKILFKRNFETIQNWLGLTILSGLCLFYVLNIIQGLYADSAYRDSIFDLKEWEVHWQYNLMLLYPLVVISINLIRRLRVKKVVAVLSMLMFLPRLMEFFIVYTVSNVTLGTMNSVYTDPMLQILIAGPILYVVIAKLASAPTVTASLDE